MNSALPKTIIPTGCTLDSVKSLFTVSNVFLPPPVPMVTLLSAARATADLFKMAISAVILPPPRYGGSPGNLGTLFGRKTLSPHATAP